MDSYSAASYFVSKLVGEAPLSALFPCFARVLLYKLCAESLTRRLARFITIFTVKSFASSLFSMPVGRYAQSMDAEFLAHFFNASFMKDQIVYSNIKQNNLTPCWEYILNPGNQRTVGDEKHT